MGDLFLEWYMKCCALLTLLLLTSAVAPAPAPFYRNTTPHYLGRASLHGEWFMGWQADGRHRDDPVVVAGYRVNLHEDGTFHRGRRDAPDAVGTWDIDGPWVVMRETGTLRGWPKVYEYRVPRPPIYEALVPDGYDQGVMTWLVRPRQSSEETTR